MNLHFKTKEVNNSHGSYKVNMLCQDAFIQESGSIVFKNIFFLKICEKNKKIIPSLLLQLHGAFHRKTRSGQVLHLKLAAISLSLY